MASRLAVLLCAFGPFGCSSTVKLEPTVAHPQSLETVPFTVGVYHSPKFRSYQHVADAYGNKHRFVFPIGAASDTLFKEIYPRVFNNVLYLKSRLPAITEGPMVSVVIEPGIEEFQFPLQSLKGPYWAQISYRFILYSPAGDTLAAWTVKGSGESGDGTTYGEFGPIADATEQALQNAATSFVKSFVEVPEVKRWALGLPREGATAAANKQETRSAPELGADAVRGIYEGVVAVTARPEIQPGEQSAPGMTQLKAAGIVPIEVFVKNDSDHQLLIRRSDIALLSPKSDKVSAVPASFIAAVLTTRRLRLGPVAPGVGLAALPNLFVSLINAAAMEAERRELTAHLETYRKGELRDAVLGKTELVRGLVYFPYPPGSPASTQLEVPIIDLDAATRYLVRLPLRVPKRN